MAGIEEPGPTSHAELIVPEDCDIDEDEDAYVCEINANDHYRLCKARAAHDLVISNPDTLLAKKTLSAAAAPHLRTQDLITKPDDVAKVVELDVPAILQEQLKDPVLSIVRSWIERNTSPDLKTPEIRQSKGLPRYGQELDRLLIEEHGQLLCYDQPSDTLDERNLRICLPLSLFLACFRKGHYNELGGHMGASKTYANANFDFIIGQGCSTGSALLQLIVLRVRIVNQSLNILMRCLWKNDRGTPHHFAQYISTIQDPSIHRATGILTVF